MCDDSISEREQRFGSPKDPMRPSNSRWQKSFDLNETNG
jgi:hypothetical protein